MEFVALDVETANADCSSICQIGIARFEDGCLAEEWSTLVNPEDDQQTSMFLVDARPHEIDDGDVVPRLTSRTESMAEHEPEGSLEHCFVGLLKASLLIKSQNFVSRGEFLVRAREKAFNLRPI